MKKRILIGVIALLLVVGLLLPGALVSASPGQVTLTLHYYAAMDGATDPVSGLTVRVQGTGYNQYKYSVSGTTSFTVTDNAKYSVTSTKGAFTRTDLVDIFDSNLTKDIPCGKLIPKYYAAMDGATDPLSGLTVEVMKTGAGKVDTRYSVTGQTSFNLLSTTDTDATYDVISTQWAFTRTETGVTVASDKVLDVPCGKLIVTYYANDNAAWGMTAVTVEVKKTGAGKVDTRYSVNGQTSFNLLSTTGTGATYYVISTKGASSRTDTDITVASTQTLDVSVARFRVAIVKADFTAQSPLTVEVRTAAGNVDWRYSVNGSTDFSLFQSSGTGGAGQYTFIATKRDTTTAQITVSADPPPGLAGVILMLP